MKRAWWIVIPVAIVGWLVVRHDDGKPRAPDQRLASHFAAICKIADRNVESPLPGARAMFRYFGDHGPEMLREWGELLVLIERIDDDAAHDARARAASRRFDVVFARCAEPMNEFLSAVEEDPEASALAQRNFERLQRTLDILGGAGAQLVDLPALVRARLDLAR